MGIIERKIINIAKLDNGEEVVFKEQFKSKKRGFEAIKHPSLKYLGEGVHYSCGGHRRKPNQRAHFFTW